MQAVVDEYLIAAWLRLAPNAATSAGFPRGFWPDVARAAVELALTDIDTELSFVPTKCERGDYEEGRAVFTPRLVKGLDVSKLEFRL